jgi:hypothetical protein
MNKITTIVLILFLVACGEENGVESQQASAVAGSTDVQTHLGGCILMSPVGDVPTDPYLLGDVVPAKSIAPFTKELQVYGLRLAARDDASDDFMRLVARTITEVFPQSDDLDSALQREVLANHYRYNALIPVPVGDDFSFMEDNAEQWELLESENTVCDIIMQDVPARQVMEVVEHILHYVTDVGLHYTFPNEWGIDHSSTVAEAMRIAVENGYYDISGYDDIDDEDVRFRVELQEFAYWFISTAWNLQEPYGPAEEEEWTIKNQEELKAKLPALYEAYERTAARVMVAPSLATLIEIGPTWAEEKAN